MGRVAKLFTSLAARVAATAILVCGISFDTAAAASAATGTRPAEANVASDVPKDGSVDHAWSPRLTGLRYSSVGVARVPTGNGYWVAGSDGGVFTYAGAHFYGSGAGQHFNAPVAGIAASPTGHGYWLVGRDGGVFAYGDAHFRGSGAAF